MPKKRIHELAKELGLESKVLIARLEKNRHFSEVGFLYSG